MDTIGKQPETQFDKREELLEKLYLMRRLRFIASFCILFWGLFMWFFDVSGFEPARFFLLCFSEMFVNQPYNLFVKRIKDLNWVIFLHQFFDVVLITIGIYLLGGTSAYFATIIYSLIIIFAGVVISIRSTFLIAALCSSGYLILFLLEEFKIIPRKLILGFQLFPPLNFLILIFICMSFFLIAYVTSFLVKIIIKKTKESKEILNKMNQAENAMIQAEKLAVVGQFTTGIIHEVKNPLGVIYSGIEFLEGEISDRPDLLVSINKIKQSTLHANEIINDLLNFSRPTEQSLQLEDLNTVVLDNLKLLKEVSACANIDILKEISSRPVMVKLNRNQFEEVIFNIMINACDAMPNSGRIIIRTFCQEYSQKGIKSGFRESSRFVVGENVAVLEVQDEGAGIPQENLSKIFDPFFTTKNKKENTGLGLAICRKIIDAHKGEIEIKSAVGKGTIVVIRLPLFEQKERK